ncbi:MAG: alpha/beta fold hydrolase [Deltaproteobacteria bacterium]|nr:alpha/beta fold hydrolase [Deltaproteobacteria bacterium]
MTTIRRETGFLERDGERIYYEDVGEGDAVVLCHGAGGNHAIWFQQVPVFARHRRVVTWDHRGFGRSTAVGGAAAPSVSAGDLFGLLDHLGIGQADLIGQSMGGWTALQAALRDPARVRRLVLANTPGGIQTAQLDAAWKTLGAGGLEAPEALGTHPALAESLNERSPDLAYLYQMLSRFGEPDLGKMALDLVTTTVARPELTKLGCSVLFTTGEEDGLFSPELIRATAALVPGARVEEFAQTGHSPYFERPERWNEVVGEFLGIPTTR